MVLKQGGTKFKVVRQYKTGWNKFYRWRDGTNGLQTKTCYSVSNQLELEQRIWVEDLSKAGTIDLVQAQFGTKEELSYCSNIWEEQSMQIPGIKQDEHAL